MEKCCIVIIMAFRRRLVSAADRCARVGRVIDCFDFERLKRAVDACVWPFEILIRCANNAQDLQTADSSPKSRSDDISGNIRITKIRSTIS